MRVASSSDCSSNRALRRLLRSASGRLRRSAPSQNNRSKAKNRMAAPSPSDKAYCKAEKSGLSCAFKATASPSRMQSGKEPAAAAITSNLSVQSRPVRVRNTARPFPTRSCRRSPSSLSSCPHPMVRGGRSTSIASCGSMNSGMGERAVLPLPAALAECRVPPEDLLAADDAVRRRCAPTARLLSWCLVSTCRVVPAPAAALSPFADSGLRTDPALLVALDALAPLWALEAPAPRVAPEVRAALGEFDRRMYPLPPPTPAVLAPSAPADAPPPATAADAPPEPPPSKSPLLECQTALASAFVFGGNMKGLGARPLPAVISSMERPEATERSSASNAS